jgi:hypothetical protein
MPRRKPLSSRHPSRIPRHTTPATHTRSVPRQSIRHTTQTSHIPRPTTDTRTRTISSRAPRRILIFFLVQALAWQKDSAIEGIWQTAMSAADLHRDDDEFGQGAELAGEGGVDAWEAETESDGAVRGDDFE